METNGLSSVLKHFNIQGTVVKTLPWGSGHINETYRIYTDEKEYILQKINTTVFPNTANMMENISGVTEFIKSKLIAENRYSDRHALYLIKTHDGASHLENELGFWRMYNYIGDSVCLDKSDEPMPFYQSGVGFGTFQRMLEDYPAETLHETIENFHNTPVRFETFKKVVAEDVMGRKKLVEKEIQFYMGYADFYSVLTDMLHSGELPLRVTHNDTKLNNVMLDKETLEALCVVDLDTVMPGLSAYDFGDAIRFGASTGAEDETDLSKVELDLNLYKAFTNGFLSILKDSLTPNEIKALPMGAKMMTLECGMRFLGDYLAGDVYFRIHKEHHNLDRCRTQIKLVEEMEKKQGEIDEIIGAYL